MILGLFATMICTAHVAAAEDESVWPKKIERVDDEETLKWLEDHIYLITLWPREPGLNLMADTAINEENVKKLTSAAELAWDGIMEKNLELFV